MESKGIKVAFIAGAGRSGSTLLDRMLGQLDGCCSVGELTNIWDGIVNNRPCGCGELLTQCGFWTEVVERVYRDLPCLDPHKAVALRRWTRHLWNIPAMALPIRTPLASKKLHSYTSLLGKLYEAIREVSGSSVIIDSSKSGFHGLVLRSVSNIELYVLHLVRDSRAVAFSRARERLQHTSGDFGYMRRYNTAKSALMWDLGNAGIPMLRLGHRHYRVIRYEDLVASPKDMVTGILDHLGYTRADQSSLDFIDGYNVKLKVNHTVSGNPMRFDHGVIKIHPDMEWQQKMAKMQKFTVTALTWPLLLKYGYMHG